MSAPVFYKPSDGWLADVIPFHWNGGFHLFYLKDYRDVPGHGNGTPWFHLATDDFVTFEDLGEALPRGGDDAQDQFVFTGSVIERDGIFHIFYTGHNETFRGTDRPAEAIMHATSPDLDHWTKDAANPILFAPTDRYEQDDWRDPFVYWDPAAQEFRMLLAARTRQGPSNRRGCVALAASPDLEHWQVREPFWTPELYFTHECPDLFQIGDDWCLVYSTFSERTVTHFRTGPNPQGPWSGVADDQFDTRAFYAAKTASDGRNRYLFGWLASRAGERDDGAWQWGGTLVVHEMAWRDGAMVVSPPATVVGRFSVPVSITPEPRLGTWDVDGAALTARVPDAFAYLRLAAMPDTCSAEVTLAIAPGTRSAGIVLRADDTLDSYYLLRVEPSRNRIVFDRWPRPGDEPFVFERPLPASDSPTMRLRVLTEGSAIVAYVDDRVALSVRGYEVENRAVGLFVSEGSTTFTNIAVTTPA
jgi:beta-fructofuranosidase